MSKRCWTWGLSIIEFGSQRPRHNGKVERQHRIDGERFYSRLRMFSLEDGRKQLADYQRRSNKIWKPCLGMKSPNQAVEQYLGVM